jgi:4-diphosphocytidyl-2-C-methyl-D-erythritol kinase
VSNDVALLISVHPTMRTFITRSPAKLNLFLHILGRRADGYHELQTVFQLIDCYDALEFTRRTDGTLGVHCISIAPWIDLAAHPELQTQDNLVIKAARALQNQYEVSFGVDIRIGKRIPIGGGLGGGSSNAAITLLVLNRLWGLHRPLSELISLGLTLGADVPVFLHGKTAWGEGLGERLTPIKTEDNWFVVVVPKVTVSTPQIFSDPQLTRNTPPITMQTFLQQTVRTKNDCEAVVSNHYIAVSDALRYLDDLLLKGEPRARMTGTGGCVFAQLTSQSEAESVCNLLPTVGFTGLTGFVAKDIPHFSPDINGA